MKTILKYFLFLFLLCNSSLIFGQQFIVSGNSYDNFSLGYSKVIGQDESGYFVITSNRSIDLLSERSGRRNRKYKLGYFSTVLKLKWEKVIEAYPNKANLEDISFFNDHVMVISSLENSNEKKVSYFLSFVDSTGKSIDNDSPVTSFSPISNDYEKCKIIVSTSQTCFAIVTRDFSGDDEQKLYASVITSELKASPTITGTIPFTEKTFDLVGYTIGNEGDLAILGLNSEKIKSLSSKRTTDYILYSAPANNTTFKDFNISNNKTITGIGISFDNVNRQTVLAGFYSEKDSYVGAGIYYASLKMETNEVVNIKTNKIDEQNNLKLKGERNSGSGIDLISYPIQRMILRNDGGAVIVAEAAYVSEYSYYDSFSQSFTRRLEYNYDNIIVISINNEGMADWSRIIEKQQSTLDDEGVFSSFCSLLNNEQLAILYNDQITRRNRITPISIDNLGQEKKLETFDVKDGILLIPRNGKQVSENEIVIPALIKRKLYFVKVIF